MAIKIPTKRLIIVMISLLGIWHMATAGYMLSKAWLSQVLIAQAWQKTLQDKQHHRPWSWADGYPVAQLTVPRLQKQRHILSGSSARNLAFAATHLPQSGLPGDAQSIVIAGHNDSHFAFLQNVVVGDEIQLNSMHNNQQLAINYVVNKIDIIDSKKHRVKVIDQQQLILITCYPFGGLSTGTSLRYVVQAVPKKNQLVKV